MIQCLLFYAPSKGYEKVFPVVVEMGKIIQIKGGAIHHESLIGKPYGSKVCPWGSHDTSVRWWSILCAGRDNQRQELGGHPPSHSRALDSDLTSPHSNHLLY